MGLMVLWATMPADAQTPPYDPPECPPIGIDDKKTGYPVGNPTHCFDGAAGKWVTLAEAHGIQHVESYDQRHTYSQKHSRRGTSVAPSANSLQAPHGFHADAEHWLDYEFRCIRSQTDGTTPGTTPGTTTTTRPENC